mgnify:CR=1 FL=1
MALRWRKDPRETGLRAVVAGPRGSGLYDGIIKYATVNAMGRYSGKEGWYYVCGWNSGVPHFNSCDKLCADEATAKAEAMAYVRKHLDAPQKKEG